MGSRHFKVHSGLAGETIAPINEAITARVDGRLQYRTGHIAPQRMEKIAGTTAGIAGRKYLPSVFFEDVPANRFSGLKHSSMGHGSAKRSRQTDHRGDVVWSLSGDRTRQDATETVADYVQFSTGILQRLLDTGIQMLLDQNVGTLGVDSDAGKIRPVSDSSEPCVKLCEIGVRAQKSRHENDC